MVRTLLAVLAFFVFSHTAGAESPLSPGQRQSFNSYAGKVRKEIISALQEIGYVGRARVDFQVLASGKIVLESVNATDRGLKQRLRSRLAPLRFPSPPAWMGAPVNFTVPIVVDPS